MYCITIDLGVEPTVKFRVYLSLIESSTLDLLISIRYDNSMHTAIGISSPRNSLAPPDTGVHSLSPCYWLLSAIAAAHRFIKEHGAVYNVNGRFLAFIHPTKTSTRNLH